MEKCRGCEKEIKEEIEIEGYCKSCAKKLEPLEKKLAFFKELADI